MTFNDDPARARYRAQAQAEIRRNKGVMFPYVLTFVLGPSTWKVNGNVKDPQDLKPDALAQLQIFASARNLAYTDLRVLKVDPEDTVPYPGATCPWDDGVLEVLDWSQAKTYSGIRTGTCVLRRG